LLEQQREHLSPEVANRTDAGLLAFRALHLQGRTLGLLLPRAIGDVPFQRYTYVDGEGVAGSVLGWNFGEGHLADERLLRVIQAQCHFQPGEVRVISVEAQPILGSTLHWRITDAHDGQLAEGHVQLEKLTERKPWDFGMPGSGSTPENSV